MTKMPSLMPKPSSLLSPPSKLSAIPPKPIQQPLADDQREFGDVKKTRKFIDDDVLHAVSNMAPLQNDVHTLRLTNVRYVDPDRFSKQQHKQAILTGETLGRRIKGVWELVDNATGGVIDRREQVVARVPHMTDLGTFVQNGSDRTLNHQQRLQPGVYTRIKENGELESHANVLPGKGVSHRYMLDPEKGVFHIKFGQSSMPLIPLLRSMGATDAELREAWGPELVASNSRIDDGGVLRKLRDKLLRKADREGDEESARQKLISVFENMELDPEVNKSTLGHPYARMNKDAILATTRKLLAVSRGEQDVDDRDHLAYQRFLGPEDLLRERIERDHGRLRQELFRKLSFQKSLAKMPSGLMTQQIEQALLHSGLGMAIEEINPAEVFDKQSRITRLGEGGIPCYSEDMDVFTAAGWKRWPDVTADDLFACNENGLTFKKASALFAEQYTGVMLQAATKRVDYLVTPNHRCWVSKQTTGVSTQTPWQFFTAEAIHGKNVTHRTAVRAYAGGRSDGVFVLQPAPTRNGNKGSSLSDPVCVAMLPWVQFLGAYLAGGNTDYAEDRKEYRVEISKRRSKNPQEYDLIVSVLEQLPFTWRYERDKRFVISGKYLAWYLKQFGTAANKYVPEYILHGSLAVRDAFFKTITACDNSGRSSHSCRYASASERLRDDVAFIGITLGKSPTYYTRVRDGENAQYGVLLKNATTARVCRQKKNNQYSTLNYAGTVYCASVPGNMLLVRRNGKVHWSGNSLDAIPDEARSVQPSHMGFMDPLRTPESFRVGVDVHLARNARKGRDGKIYTQMKDPRTGNLVWKTPQELASAAVTMPDALRWPSKRIPIIRNGVFDYVKKREVDFVVPHAEGIFSPLGNLVPLKSMVKGQRVAMASRMTTQALPLVDPEAPLVQGAVPGTSGARSFEDEYGKHMGAIHAEKGGRVLDVKDGSIHVQYDDGVKDEIELYQHHPFNRKTFLHQTPTLERGQLFKAGDALARSNYTDVKGATALGKNFRVAYVPYMGYNFEDANVISESAARKMSSEHMYQHDFAVTDKHKVGRNAFINLFPQKYDRKTLAKLDDQGVIQVGQTVEFGDPLILAARERDRAHNKIHKQRQAAYNDDSITWKHHDPGIVTDVVWGKKGPTVLVKSVSAMQVGDKMSGRYGDKGVVAAIIPDDQMPHDASGQPYEVLLNPLGVISRTNPAQKVEAMLGKLAQMQGKPIKVPDFEDDRDMTEWAIEQLRKAGLSSKEKVYNPGRNRAIEAATGMRFFMKLHHTAESKGQGRGSGGYSADETPSKGGETGCFVGSTMVETDYGAASLLHLVSKKEKDKARTRNLETGKDEFREVTDWFQYSVSPSELVDVVLENGQTLQVTKNHEFVLANGERRRVCDLKPGDDLME